MEEKLAVLNWVKHDLLSPSWSLSFQGDSEYAIFILLYEK